jgi:hypothetical protein
MKKLQGFEVFCENFHWVPIGFSVNLLSLRVFPTCTSVLWLTVVGLGSTCTIAEIMVTISSYNLQQNIIEFTSMIPPTIGLGVISASSFQWNSR